MKRLTYHTEVLLSEMVKYINDSGIGRDDILMLEKGSDGLYMLLYYV